MDPNRIQMGPKTGFAGGPIHRLGIVSGRIFWDPLGGSRGGPPGGGTHPPKKRQFTIAIMIYKIFFQQKIFFSKCVSKNNFYKNKNYFVYTFFDQQKYALLVSH